MAIYLKSPDEIAIMREAGRIVARAHAAMREAVRPGVSTSELDKIGETVLRDHGATPAFLNYPKRGAPDFPASITASINNELVHGIPSPDRILQEGDIISLDIGCHYQGFVGDSAYTYAVGEVSASVQRLLDVTERALYVGIEASVLPHGIRDVCLAIQRYVESNGYSVAREYTGHGVGRAMHEEPEVPNWWSRQVEKMGRSNHSLQVGMTYALEPMVIAGRAELKELKDGWTVVTKDKSLCAHFEHTIAITEGKPVILTLL
ncbi:MAG: type I methionyl aminopeptidase [Anaerolineae bacterium]